MHAEARWPEVISSNLWPYALREANETLNATPSKVTGQVANQMFAGTEAPTVLRHFHPFGCPTYVLNNSLAAGKSIPKWHKRARLGVYLGRSPNHSQSVALVLNLATGLVSPQFHLKFDDLFETVKGERTFPNNWKAATHFRKTSKADRLKGAQQAARREEAEMLEPVTIHDAPPEQEVGDLEGTADGDQRAPEQEGTPHQQPTEEPAPDEHEIRRWSRRHKPTQRLIESRAQAAERGVTYHTTTEQCECHQPHDMGCGCNGANDYDSDVYHGDEEYEIQRQMADPIAFAASADPDIMYLHEAMKQPDKKEFVQAMVDEVTTHTE